MTQDAGNAPTRRQLLAGLGGTATLAAAGIAQAAPWHNDDIAGAMPDLAFTLTRARDGKAVTAADYRGKIVLLYFGYTFCPDVCPTTLGNVATILDSLGRRAQNVRFLFVTVDPNRDTAPVLNEYAAEFAPEVEGMRAGPNALAALARRYRVTYSVTPSPDPTHYEVTHSSAIFAFDRQGHVRLLVTSLGTAQPDITGTEADLRRLIAGGGGGLGSWLRGLL